MSEKDKEFEITNKMLIDSMTNAIEDIEKALRCDDKGLRKKIETLLKRLIKSKKNMGKKRYRKVVEKMGLTIKMLNDMLSLSIFVYREALNLDDNNLRECIEKILESVYKQIV